MPRSRLVPGSQTEPGWWWSCCEFFPIERYSYGGRLRGAIWRHNPWPATTTSETLYCARPARNPASSRGSLDSVRDVGGFVCELLVGEQAFVGALTRDEFSSSSKLTVPIGIPQVVCAVALMCKYHYARPRDRRKQMVCGGPVHYWGPGRVTDGEHYSADDRPADGTRERGQRRCGIDGWLFDV